MNIVLLLLILMSYILVGMVLNQSILANETFWTQILRAIRAIYEKPSQKGFLLIEELILIKTQQSQKLNIELTEYKGFTKLISEMCTKMRELGRVDLSVIDFLIKVLKEDISNQRKLEEIERKGYCQFSLIQFLTIGFLYYAANIFEIYIPLSSIVIVSASYLIGVSIFYFTSKAMVKRSLKNIERI
jgi:hypothetical protein